MVKSFFPKTLAEALSIRSGERAVPVAGGTDWFVKYRRGAGLPADSGCPVLFLGGIGELRAAFREKNGSLVIGAGTTLTEILGIPEAPPILNAAVREIAAPAIRNAATLGGNICNASPAGDSLPPLYVLEAELLLASVRGARCLALRDFILGPGKTALADDELLTAVRIPPIPERTRWYYRKVGTRRAQALSKVSLAALFFADDEAPQNGWFGPRPAHFAFGAVGPRVVRDENLETLLEGRDFKKMDDLERNRLLDALRKAVMAAVAPIDDQRSTADYRRRVAAGLAAEAVTEAGLFLPLTP